jgi:predicted TIM-barrel fold metal-dependent hydrolase
VRRVAALGARGLKLHPNTQAFDVSDEPVATVVAAAADAGLPVLFDAYSPWDANQPGKFVTLAMQVPDARLVLAHMHGPHFPELVMYEVLTRYPWWRRNVWFDLSAVASMFAGSPFQEQFAWVCRQVGTDRVVFGSDFPLDSPATALAALDAYGFSDTELTAIAHDNAADLFGLGSR